MTNPWVSTIVGAILGIILSYLLWLWTKPKARLYSRMGDSLLVDTEGKPDAERLEISFAGQRVPRLTSTSWGLWNGGNVTIDGSDISPVDPLRLVVVDGEILQVSMEEQTRNGNDAAVTIGMGSVADVTFDYLDKGDGFRVRVLHTGKPGAVQQTGQIKRLPQGIEVHDPNGGLFGLVAFARIMVSATVLGITGSIGQYAYPMIAARDYPGLIKTALYISGFVFIFVVAVWIIGKWDARPNSKKVRGIPDAITNERVLMRRWPQRLS